MQFLLHAYQKHGCTAAQHGDWIVVEQGCLLTRASTYNENEQAGVVILQADFLTVTPEGHHILESFAGFGPDQISALRDACESFLDSTFHAILSALLARPSEHATTLRWDIGGTARQLTFGSVRMRGAFPGGAWPEIFASLENETQKVYLPKGLHWARYFYSHVPGRPPTVEALLDNETWPEMQGKMPDFPWPQSEEFYSARLFTLIEDAPGPFGVR